MSQKRINVELSDPLIDGHGLQYTKEELVDLFRGDNINNLVEGEEVEVGISLHNLVTIKGGTERLVHALSSDVKDGIEGTPEDIAQRRNKYGTNEPLQRKITTICDMIGECFDDLILQILVVAAVASMGIGIYKDGWEHGWIDGTSIIVAILIIVIVTVSNNYVKEKQFQELQSKSDVMTARTTRGGVEALIDSTELVVGDIIEIPSGSTVPADCIVIKSTDLSLNENMLTGEPDQKPKESVTMENYGSNPNPFLIQTTMVEDGTGTAIVVAVGTNTFVGRTGLTMNIEKDLTPLQKKLETIAEQIGKLGLYCAILTFIAMSIRLLCKIFLAHTRTLDDGQNIMDVLDAFIIGLTVIVVAVPEGLPLAVTISLAFSVGAMADKHNLVKKLHASETMGNANEICTDKTGTLTQNKMTVMEAYFEDQIVAGKANPALKHSPISELVIEAVIYNCSASITTDIDTGKKETTGNVTEIGMINYLLQSDYDCESMLKQKKDVEYKFAIPFNSKRKRQTSAIKHPSQEGKIRVFCKGAPEIVIDYCNSYLGENGSTEHMTEDKRTEIIHERVVKKFAAKTYRTMLIAYADYDEAEWESMKAENNDFKTLADKEIAEEGLTLIGIFALVDPLRPGIEASVDRCHRSGINVRMVTGDNIDTAIAISKQAHILNEHDLANNEDGYVCMSGGDFREAIGGEVTLGEKDIPQVTIKNMNAFRKITKKLKVLARSLPDDKFMLVHGLIEEGNTVAVTGDGTNDAPALNRADVGFAMGIAGTDVAKSAADIVLTDDNFCSIEVAIKYGRNIFDNVRKFLQFQLTVNVAALIIVFTGSVIFDDPPLTSVQMLWVNLIMDTFAALALATEPPNDALLERKPARKSQKIVNAVMWRNIFGQGLYQLIVLLVLLCVGADLFGFTYERDVPFYYTQEWIDEQIAAGNEVTVSLNEATEKCVLYTIVFQTFVFMQLFNQFNARKLGDKEYNIFAGFCNNPWFICITILTFVIQYVMVQYGGRPLRATPLDNTQQAICLALGSFSLLWGVIIKVIIPSRLFECLSMDEKEMSDKEEQASFVAGVRKSFRQSTTKRLDKIDQPNINN